MRFVGVPGCSSSSSSGDVRTSSFNVPLLANCALVEATRTRGNPHGESVGQVRSNLVTVTRDQIPLLSKLRRPLLQNNPFGFSPNGRVYPVLIKVSGLV